MKPFLALLLLTVGHAMASDLNFVLANDTKRDYEAVYLSPSNDKDWNGNLLSKGQVLNPAEQVEVKFPAGQDEAAWDLNIVDEDGLAVAFQGINLIDVKKVTLVEKDGKINVIVE